ncbi:hypothetical protein DY000_02052911 [Brassica cretica]|uniref:Uncharacterized protein n=1 Tax=Brassica cretica TaxID=69181 RepID=A0ABQ7AIC7_BRACR|nr:hypothetical protein DY000_02052911 [Brassica cretica]
MRHKYKRKLLYANSEFVQGATMGMRHKARLGLRKPEYAVNQHPVSEVMPVLLKSGQSASREEAVEEMQDCRSMKQHWCH